MRVFWNRGQIRIAKALYYYRQSNFHLRDSMGDICERVDHVLANIESIGAEEAVMTNFGGDLTPGESELLRRKFPIL